MGGGSGDGGRTSRYLTGCIVPSCTGCAVPSAGRPARRSVTGLFAERSSVSHARSEDGETAVGSKHAQAAAHEQTGTRSPGTRPAVSASGDNARCSCATCAGAPSDDSTRRRKTPWSSARRRGCCDGLLCCLPSTQASTWATWWISASPPLGSCAPTLRSPSQMCGVARHGWVTTQAQGFRLTLFHGHRRGGNGRRGAPG